MKKPGYDTLRFLLCAEAILVEGDADELVVQRAYKDKYSKLPIEDEIDIISVGTTFLRFLEIAEKLEKQTVVVTDNDGDIRALERKYSNYIGKNSKEYINICYDNKMHTNQGSLVAKNGGKFNYDTLEPCIVRANSLEKINKILNKNYTSDDDLIEYMIKNKTDCALKIFNAKENINYPNYIKKAIGDYGE
ncbi:MAG: ATP-dependent endonuclease [Clostridia bacterium]